MQKTIFLICGLLVAGTLSFAAGIAKYNIVDFMKIWEENSVVFEENNKGKVMEITAIVASVQKAPLSRADRPFLVKLAQEEDEYGPGMPVAYAFFADKSGVLKLKVGGVATFQCVFSEAGPANTPFFENCKTISFE